MADAFASAKPVFFLGGRDLEMLTIRDLMAEHAPGRFHDKGLPWGAKASDCQGEARGLPSG